LMPYVLALAQPDWMQHSGLRDGLNVQAGRVSHPALEQYVT